MVHQPVSRGLEVFADAWLWGWLAEISAETVVLFCFSAFFVSIFIFHSSLLNWVFTP